ncbi:MAG: hypothetical protein DME33_00085 [Verrucomicrobia bacterium]|nr:MAG: hypothetical protein DME33_00085 [Verrucomicrobiota bacterium]
MHVEFLDLGNLGREEPMPILVVAKLRRNFKRDISGLASIFLYSFHAPRPQIGVGAVDGGGSSWVGGLIFQTYSGSESQQGPHARTEGQGHHDKH